MGIKRKYLKIMALFLAIVLFVCVLLAVYFLKKSEHGDVKEIKPGINTVREEVRSERGFGNDRLDVLSYTIKNGKRISGFKDIDGEFDEAYAKHFKEILNSNLIGDSDEASHIRLAQMKLIKKDIALIKISRGSKYIITHEDGTRKLFVHNEITGRGYCFVLTI
ncbi:hypothetical protein ACGCUQ_00600 [Eubacteriales bacterium KG127]